MALPKTISASDAQKMGWGTQPSNTSGTPSGGLPKVISASQAQSMGWNISPTTTAPNSSQPTLTGSDNKVGSLPVVKQSTQVGAGIGSGIGKSLANIPKALLQFSQGVSNVGSKILGGQPANYQPAIDAISKASSNLFDKPVQPELNTVGGQIGNVIGQAAPYVATGGVTSELSNATSGAKVLKGAGALPVLGRTIAGATAEGLANAGTGYALSGGDTKQALTQGLTAGALKAGTAGIGEIANGLKIPESKYGKIFTTNKQEVNNSFNNPNSKSLAQEALDRGIAGSTKGMAQQLIKGSQDSEAKISQEFAKAGNPKISLEEPQRFVDYLTSKANQLKQAGAIKEASGLQSSISAIDPTTGEITANNALGLRRFLDGLRNDKSFISRMNPTEELSAQQAGLKEMSDEIRHKINAIGGTGETMKDYQFYTKALDKLTSHAVKTKNNDSLGLINSFLLGDSIANANPALGALGVARKITTTTRGATAGSQILKNLPKSSSLGSTARSAIADQAARLLNTTAK